MKIPWTIVVVLAFASLATAHTTLLPSPIDGDSRRWTAGTDNDVRERLAQLDLPFDIKYSSTIRDVIKDYAINGYRQTEYMLGRAPHYFPVFEHYLELYDVPAALKYLPIVETKLVSRAYSGAGAAGLWQFIPPTARLYDLKVNSQVDERLDLYRSSEAAAKMLALLYKQYKSWPLVLAAYNCGPVRVNQAIRQAGCRNYWELSIYLPQETQDYIPRYIAAAYIANFYADHGLQPDYVEGWPTQASVLKVYDELTFGEIAFAAGLDLNILQSLNPSFKKRIVPANASGNYLVIPSSAVERLRSHIRALNGGGNWTDPIIIYPNFHKLNYLVKPGETLQQVASKFDCTVDQIVAWNQLRKDEVVVNELLSLYLADAGKVKP
jgi:membrane-bound lytic murein transglycosylase D